MKTLLIALTLSARVLSAQSSVAGSWKTEFDTQVFQAQLGKERGGDSERHDDPGCHRLRPPERTGRHPREEVDRAVQGAQRHADRDDGQQPHRPAVRELRFTDLYAHLAAEVMERRRAEEAS